MLAGIFTVTVLLEMISGMRFGRNGIGGSQDSGISGYVSVVMTQ